MYQYVSIPPEFAPNDLAIYSSDQMAFLWGYKKRLHEFELIVFVEWIVLIKAGDYSRVRYHQTNVIVRLAIKILTCFAHPNKKIAISLYIKLSFCRIHAVAPFRHQLNTTKNIRNKNRRL